MTGNVFEWCWDWYGTPYEGGTDPHSATGSERAIRGGSWIGTSDVLRCADRGFLDPAIEFSIIGFRAVLASGQ